MVKFNLRKNVQFIIGRLPSSFLSWHILPWIWYTVVPHPSSASKTLFFCMRVSLSDCSNSPMLGKSTDHKNEIQTFLLSFWGFNLLALKSNDSRHGSGKSGIVMNLRSNHEKSGKVMIFDSWVQVRISRHKFLCSFRVFLTPNFHNFRLRRGGGNHFGFSKGTSLITFKQLCKNVCF